MTDMTPDEQLADDAKTAALLPPEPVPGAADLPDDVPAGDPTADDGNADSDDGTVVHDEEDT